jgi:hypothetical protein
MHKFKHMELMPSTSIRVCIIIVLGPWPQVQHDVAVRNLALDQSNAA